ncbi:sigma-70 family RNA polymerase sigma factor [Polyangium sp. y55x31]|uniref:sigma-70 family RNA polymerase sigma factor n=1 Tax=Polyangium sp. y55x31 TaxID=3042688 RepID=UPI002482DE97|nr:sigma-70 family RNA polymerase sigma factor [Polyangium sp. y55x31]MDI1478625.1 sigma-70 family RNA polymerase sigma factor [Polyangium sp. y55x31]
MSVTMPAAVMAATPERIPGAAFRAAAALHLQRNSYLSREALARDLRERLARHGIRYHLRTLKRQLSGAVATVPPEVERALRDMIAEAGGADAVAEIEQALVEAGLSGASAATTPTYIACERMLPLAQLWLYLHPERSKRALAFRLREELQRIGIRLNVDSLQSILAGKQRLVRREIQDALFSLLRNDGVTSAADAEARIETMSREIRGAQEGRAFESARTIHELARAWKIEHKEPSSRRLALLLKQRLAERGITIGLPHVQKLVDGRARRVRHAMARAIESILRGDAAPVVTEAPAPKDALPAGTELDLAWVKAAPIAELARQHVAVHPGMTMRKLAIQISREVEALGYATSPNTIQPILGGHKKKTRGFIYRAMLHLGGAAGSRVPHEHVFGAPRSERSTEPPPAADPPADSETSPRSRLAPKASSSDAAHRKPRSESLGVSPAQSPFGAYRAAIQRYQALDRETELELAWRYRRDGDHAAANALVESHLQFVVKVASQYRGYGMQLADLVEEGNLGLLEAVRRFEPSRNLRFKTYAIYWIRAYVVDHLLREWSIVGGGTGPLVSRTFFRLRRERAKLEMQLGEGDASIDALLATRFQTTEDAIRSMSLRVAARDTSLDAQSQKEGGPTLLETLRDPSSDPEHLTASAERDAFVRGVVDRVWKALDPRERLIVEERLLSEEDDEVSLADLGRRLGVSRERVRQLEERTKSKLRSAFEAVVREGSEAAEVPLPAAQPEPEIEALCA